MANATPNTPNTTTPSENDVLIAKKDIILFNEEAVPVELMTDLIFENIGGQELITIARTDIVNGQNVIYQPIKNLTSINFKYNPQNILALQDADYSYFDKFPINFSNKVPVCGTGPNCDIVYVDPDTGNLVINVINVARDEQVEVQILTNGIINNDTIYEVNNDN